MLGVGEVFECEIQARLRDVNLGGHVDNVEAIRILDEARILFFRYAELDPAAARPGLLGGLPDGVVELVGSQRVDYHAEMRFAAWTSFQVRLWVTRIGRSSFTVASQLRVAADHAPAIVAETSCVLWDHGTQSSWGMTDAVRARLSTYVGEPVGLR